MIFTPLPLAGAFLIEPERRADERGFFARTRCQLEYEAHGLSTKLAQCSISFNHTRGTIRGMHFQAWPHAEAKTVRCTQGAIYDVLLDVRDDSSTRGHWLAFELSAQNRRMLYLPEGFAHGFQTLTVDAEVHYEISTPFAPESARGINCFDPELGIAWPLACTVMSPKDRTLPPFADVCGEPPGASAASEYRPRKAS